MPVPYGLAAHTGTLCTPVYGELRFFAQQDSETFDFKCFSLSPLRWLNRRRNPQPGGAVMEQERRSVIRWLLGGGFAASIASFLYPAIKFMNPPDIPEASVNEVSARQGAGSETQQRQDREVRQPAGAAGAHQRDRVARVFRRLHSFELHRAIQGCQPPDLVRVS